VEAYLALGSSLGDRKANLDFAVEQLQKTEGITVERVSSYHQTAPYGGVAKNEFLNGAVAITTWLTPHELLAEVQRIERQGGRVRNVHWEDRTLDIDIIFYGQQVICDKDLQVPHPEWDKRDFVLVPLKEVAECFIPPIAGKTVKNT
jgi:dihydroneopterin aldolase/2-amino-4-hydroxy-6-hydroxymethyldihydropteridine diphosphokinase